MIDWDKFNEYLKFYDDALILEVINMFIHDLPENISTLKEKVEEKDFCKVDIIAHSLKSNFATFGATEPQELALKLEMMGKKKVDVIQLITEQTIR